MAKKDMEYAIYKGDEFLTIGTLREIADYLGITYASLRQFRSTNRVYIFVELGKKDVRTNDKDEV